MNADGTDAKNLTNHASNDHSPAWSPDGQRIAFASDRDGAFNIYIMDADGANVKAVTQGPGLRIQPAWSPDGKRILYTHDSGEGYNIFVFDVDAGTTAHFIGTKDHDDATDPAWSPDGKTIAFCSKRHKGFLSVYFMDSDSTNIRQITETEAEISHPMPAFSPDGKKLAHSHATDGSMEVFVRDADGKNPRQLTSLGGVNLSVAWSPDSKQIIFQHLDLGRITGPGPIYVMDADGSNQRVLFKQDGHARVAWRPLSKAAAVLADRHRDLAAWTLSVGGRVLIDRDGKGTYVRPGDSLPSEAFTLVSLDFNTAKGIGENDLIRVQDLATLQYLNLSSLPIGDAGLKHLKNLPMLRAIYLDRTKVTDNGLRTLAAFTSLEEILVNDTTVTANGVADLQKALPKAALRHGKKALNP